jgi:hypothetical protein
MTSSYRGRTSGRIALLAGAACALHLAACGSNGGEAGAGSDAAALLGAGGVVASPDANGSQGLGGNTAGTTAGTIDGSIAGATGSGGASGYGGWLLDAGAVDASGAGKGGVTGSGGRVGRDGSVDGGGARTSGGAPGTGGTQAAGGVPGAGGTPGTGGTQPTTIPPGAPGNPDGHCAIPADAQLEDVSTPTTVIGSGSPEGCTADAFVNAVAKGGVITFNCGADPVTITLTKPAKVWNDKGPKIVIDGGGKVTLSGGGTTRILYMNTCDKNQVWTSSHCDNQETPQLTVQNLTFINGNAKNQTETDDAGGGAIFSSGGRLKVINARFMNNVCADTGPDVGGGAIRAFQQWNGLPVYVVNSTFGGADGAGNVGSNGGALSSIGVSWTVLNTIISYNQAIGNGGNPAQSGTPGGGSGGGIYNDGNKMTLTLCGTRMEYNSVKAYGSAIFFVSNDHTGNIVIDSSVIANNIGGSWYPTYPQISNHDDTPIAVTNSTIQ